MEDFKKTSNLSENTEKTDSEITKKGRNRMFNEYVPNGGVVEVTLNDYDSNIKVLIVSTPHKHILYVNRQAHQDQLNYPLRKIDGRIHSIEVGFITDETTGTVKTLTKMLKLQEIRDANTNVHIARFIFFNDDIKDPYIIIEMSDTP